MEIAITYYDNTVGPVYDTTAPVPSYPLQLYPYFYFQGPCPNCGYCPCCGRVGWLAPIYYTSPYVLVTNGGIYS